MPSTPLDVSPEPPQRGSSTRTSLAQRVVHAGVWAFSLRALDRTLGLARVIILARLLSPEEFGLFGIALLALATVETLSQTGFQAALIQRSGETASFLDTAWSVQVIRGVLMAGVLVSVAPLVASFFAEPAAEPVLQVIAVSVLVQGFTNITVVYFQKELEFDKQFLYMFSGTLVDLAVATVTAILLRSVWALVFGLVAGNFVRMLVSYSIHPFRPRLRISIARARELYSFGKWIFASNLVVFLATKGDSALLGKLLGASALGLYQVGFRFGNLMATEVSHVIGQVTFPAYSLMQENRNRLQRAFLQTLETTIGITLPLTFGIVLLAADVVRIVLGAEWLPMVPALQILAISGMVRAVATTGGALFKAVNRPAWDLWMNMARVGAIALTIYPLTKRFGISGTAISVLIGICATIPIWILCCREIAPWREWEMTRRIAPAAIGAAFMSCLIVAGRVAFRPINSLDLGLLALVAVTGYGMCQLFVWKRSGRGLVSTLRLVRAALQ